jgi:hypothetical protein
MNPIIILLTLAVLLLGIAYFVPRAATVLRVIAAAFAITVLVLLFFWPGGARSMNHDQRGSDRDRRVSAVHDATRVAARDSPSDRAALLLGLDHRR